jgi:hypothetical protein
MACATAYSSLERSDDLVGEFLIVVASLRGIVAEVSRRLLLGTELILNSLPPSHDGRRGKGAKRTGRDQRSGSTGRTLAAVGVYARSASFTLASRRLLRTTILHPG